MYIGPDEWQAKATPRSGSWWPAWVEWLDEGAGRMVAPPSVGSKRFAPLEDAPGRYVQQH